ncbi:allophanate hydrolase subunit 1 [Glaciecola siphonariae]|uniref:Allophanate hydrolase subunit 1 n=1 Tax=Glaciecola siphonariae TaxID=521012 RepID=A0ABV9LT92_9ALTE
MLSEGAEHLDVATESLGAYATLQWVSENACLIQVQPNTNTNTNSNSNSNSNNQTKQTVHTTNTETQAALLTCNALVMLWVEHLLASSLPKEPSPKESPPKWLRQYVPSYTSLLLEYDLEYIDSFALRSILKRAATNIDPKALVLFDKDASKQAPSLSKNASHHVIEVCYDPQLSHALPDTQRPNDLDAVSQYTKLTSKEIISLHSEREYRVFSVGFLPNFAYMGLTSSALNMPRLASARKAVPAGAVAIADNQTAIYPQQSPGGWHILGYTPEPLFFLNDQANKKAQSHIEFASGDTVRFVSISLEQYLAKYSLYTASESDTSSVNHIDPKLTSDA